MELIQSWEGILSNQPLITVVIPTWNRAETLLRSISSALAQTYPPHEILVCDDGSSDNSEAIVRSIADPRVKWISGQRAGCPAIPRNRGIALSSGDWVAFLDSDDAWVPEKLEVQIALMQKRCVGAICTNAYREVNGKVVGQLISEGRSIFRFHDLVRDNKVICSSVLVRRSLLVHAGGFPEDIALRVGEDFCLWLKLSRLTAFAYSDEPLVYYQDAPITSVRALGPAIFIQRWRAFKEFLAWRRKNALSKSIIEACSITLITVGESLKAYYYDGRAQLGLLRRRFSPYSSISTSAIQGVTVKSHKASSSVMISVLMPVHNASPYLRRAVESILSQTITDFELIVIDDASTDGTSAILDDLNDPRIIRIRFEKNKGIVDALNTALNHVKGEYIARMDADDIAHPDRFQMQINFFQRFPNISVVGTWIEGFGDVRRDYIHRYPVTQDQIKASLLFECPFAHPTVMMRRTALEKLDHYYSHDFPYAEDWELWDRLISNNEASNIPIPLLKYRIHAKSSSQQFTQLQGGSKFRLLQRIYSDADLPFRDEYILGAPQSNMKWLISCLQYYKQILDSSKTSPRVNVKALEDVLQAQLILRTRQIAMFGIAPAWFIFRHGFVPRSIFQKLQTALKVLILTNVRAFITLLRTSEIYK